MGKDLILSGAPSDPDLPTQSDTPPQRREPLPFSSLMDLNGPAPGGPSLLKSTSSGDAAKALVEAWQGAAMQPATASNDGDAFGGGGAAPAGSQPTAAEMELRAQLELATARCTALEEQNSVLWQVRAHGGCLAHLVLETSCASCLSGECLNVENPRNHYRRHAGYSTTTSCSDGWTKAVDVRRGINRALPCLLCAVCRCCCLFLFCCNVCTARFVPEQRFT